MNQQAKRIKELFGYARTLTKEQGIGTMCVRAAGFFKRRFFGKRARYWPSNMALEAQRSDPAAETFPIISILTPPSTNSCASGPPKNTAIKNAITEYPTPNSTQDLSPLPRQIGRAHV